MKKRLLSLLLTIVMLFSASLCVFAEDIDFRFDNFYDLALKAAEKFPKEKTEAVRLYRIIANYLQTDTGINTLIGIIEGRIEISDDLEDFFGYFENYENYSEELAFLLKVLKSIPANQRKTAIVNFTNRNIEGTVANKFTGSYLVALNNVYNKLVPKNMRDKLKNDFNIEAKNIAILFEAIRGQFVLTNSETGNGFEVKSISSKFKANLGDNLKDYVINGRTIKDGNDAFDVLLSAINNSDILEDVMDDMKTVLKRIDNFTPASTGGGGDGGKGGKGGSGSGSDSGSTKNPIITTITDQNQVGDRFNITPPKPNGIVYVDTQEHWARDYIGVMTQYNIFKGYEDASFRPSNNITRQETAVAIVRMLGLDLNYLAVDLKFADNDEIADWAKPAVSYLSGIGVINGYEDGTFRPNNPITREEFITIMMRLSTVDPQTDNPVNFTDATEISQWAQNAVRKAVNLKLINGYEDGSFKPRNLITRAEASVVFYNFMYVEGKIK